MKHRKNTFYRENDRSWRNHLSKQADRRKRNRDQRVKSLDPHGYRD